MTPTEGTSPPISTPDLFAGSPRTSPSRRPKLRTILIAAIVLIAVIAGVIAFAVFQKPNGKAGAQALVQDYLTAVSEARVADARALVYNASETPGDPEVQQAALDAATERISNVITFEAYEVGEDALGFAVPYTYTLTGLESRGEFLVMENADGELVLKLDEGAGIVSGPDVQMPSSGDETLPYRPNAEVSVAGFPFAGPRELPLYPGVYSVEVEQAYYTAFAMSDGEPTSTVAVGSAEENPTVKVLLDGDVLQDMVAGTNALAAAKAAADAHFPSCSTTTTTRTLDESCGDLHVYAPAPVSSGTYAWTFDSDAAVDALMTTPPGIIGGKPVRATVEDDGAVLQSFLAIVPVSVDFTELLTLTNYTFKKTVTGEARLQIDVLTHPDGTQETFLGGR